ncbi:MAG: DUF4982 domain-containing protein [Prevotella sp.]|nr:DUF4982 domain-containing protein [Prevotella sp.]
MRQSVSVWAEKAWFFVLLACAIPARAAVVRDTISLNFGWQFLSGTSRNVADYVFTDACPLVDLPHDFQISQPWIAPSASEQADNGDGANNTRSRLSARGFKEMGVGVYRKTLVPDSSWRNMRVVLDFQGIMLVGDVFLNGERIGGTDYGYVGFDIDITDKLRFGRENIVLVMADTRRPENSRWYTGGGLFRDVNLVVTPKNAYFTRHPLRIKTDMSGRVAIESEVFFSDKRARSVLLGARILDAEGRCVAECASERPYRRSWKCRPYWLDTLWVDRPKLWSCESPYLYTAVVELFDSAGQVVDRVEERFGIRSIAFSPEGGLALNGKKVLLKGVANHHTLGALGAAAYPRAIEKRILLLKSFGFNHIRTAHNPYSEDFLKLCDKHGILVVDELYDKWLSQFAGGRTEWMYLWQRDVPEWVRRDRNHPSVVMWSLGNELQQYASLPFNDWGVTSYRLLRELLRRYDDERPTTVAMHPRYRNPDSDSLPPPLALETDVASYNYRYMYFPGDAIRYPKMMFYQSEANVTGLPGNFYEMDLERVLGLAYWGAIDYLGESQGWPVKGWAQGLFDLSLEPKPIAYLVKSMFAEEPVVHIAIVEQSAPDRVWNDVQVGTEQMSENWNRTDGDTVSVCTFTNADEVELFVNGRSLGRKKNPKEDPRRRNRIHWDGVAYQSGAIEAVGYTYNNRSTGVCREEMDVRHEAFSPVRGAERSTCNDGTGVDCRGSQAHQSLNQAVYNNEIGVNSKESQALQGLNQAVYNNKIGVDSKGSQAHQSLNQAVYNNRIGVDSKGSQARQSLNQAVYNNRIGVDSRGSQVHQNLKRNVFGKETSADERTIGGNPLVTRHRLETTGEAVDLKLEIDNDDWRADGMDLQHVRITAVDKKGRRVYDTDDELTFRLDGNAKLIAVCNGDMATESVFTDGRIRLFHGSALAILRSGKTPDKVCFHVDSKRWKRKLTSNTK